MAQRHHLRTPYFVSVESRHTGEAIDEDKYFASIADARSEYTAVAADRDVWAYLGEVGVFPDENDEIKVDYMVFETSNHDWWRGTSPLNRMNTPGFGRPWSHGNYATPYVPVAQYNWRL